MKQLYSNVAVFCTTVLSYHSLDKHEKKNEISKRSCRYRIVLEGKTDEQTEKLKKLHALIQESSVGFQTQLTEKSSDNLELVILQFYSRGPNVVFKENYCFSRFQRVSNTFHRFPGGVGDGELFSGGGIKMLISIDA